MTAFGLRQRGPEALAEFDRLIGYVTVSRYPNVNTYASAPGSRNVISSVSSRSTRKGIGTGDPRDSTRCASRAWNR